MPHCFGRDPFHHRNAANTKIVSVASILSKAHLQALQNKCIAAQRILVEKLIQNYYANKEVGCILAVCLNVVRKVNLEEFLDKEEVIYELIVDRVNKDDTDFLRVTFPTAPSI
jgi:hypothetical protein